MSTKGHEFYAANLHRTRFGNINYASIHAEVNVILKALKSRERNANFKKKIKLPPSTVYVVRLMRSKKDLPTFRSSHFGISKPCLNCQKYLYKYNVTKIYYTDIIDEIEVLCELRMNI